MMPPPWEEPHLCSCGKIHRTDLEVIGGYAALFGWCGFVGCMTLAIIFPFALIAYLYGDAAVAVVRSSISV